MQTLKNYTGAKWVSCSLDGFRHFLRFFRWSIHDQKLQYNFNSLNTSSLFCYLRAYFLKVYEKERQLTQEEKELAIWWSDDPDVTFSPGGHLYYLANAMVRKNQPTLIHSAQTFARVGMAVADAFINCWKWKYHFFSERPNTFIPQFIDQKWESFWPDPPFPAFPSGHAIQAGAAATVLISLYDNKTAIIDSAHVGRERDHVRNTEFVAQSFDSIWQIALETADSRFFGGIHTPQDNQVGLEQGSIIANNIVILAWKK